MSDQSQFSYPSNLVVQREQVPRSDEPTGEPESLAGRVDARQMGTLGGRDKPAKLKQKSSTLFDPRKKTNMAASYQSNEADENLIYRPKTKENRTVYEKILSMIHNQFQEQSQEIIKSVVDEIIATIKNENFTDLEKRAEVEGFLGKISGEFFSDLLLHTKLITDFNPKVDHTEPMEQEVVMPVVIDEQEQNSSDEEYEIQSDDDSQENQDDGQAIKIKNKQDDMEDVNFDGLNPSDIDAYWLHGEINKIYNDPVRTQSVLDNVMGILNLPSDIESEYGLVKFFGDENFSLVRLLHNNRHKIYYCTLLKKAANNEERDQILQEMTNTEGGLRVLEAINRGTQKTKKVEKMDEERKDDDIEKLLVEAINISDRGFQAISKKVIDLDQLSFVAQSHLMSNDKCHLPPGSFKISKKGYEEIHIPAMKHKSTKDKLVTIAELPSWAQPAFSGFKELNLVQSKVCDTAINSNENMLICAPTGAGKTNVALLTMLQVIGQYISPSGDLDLNKFKIVYVAPMKALVAEQVLNFQKRLDPYKIKVQELTGDSHLTKQQIQATQVLVVTPEKWDILTRKQGNTFLSLVRLMIIDEIHLLHDSRGPVIEAIVARTMRTFGEEQTRIVGLSATLPNYGDVAAFIRVKPSGVFHFDNSYRPVPLEQQYIGISEKKPIRRHLLMNEILYEKVSERVGKNQVLVFVHSRKETVKTAKQMKETAFSKDELSKFFRDESVSRKVIEEILSKDEVRSADLRELLVHGFAVHHAGLCRSDRDLVEQLFADKHIQVLVSTSTLAWGVNLPAHTVIIRGTQIYSPEQGRWMELSPQDILQMMGRAGRPRYDTKGEGIIITTYQELKFYLSLLNMQLPIESQFVSQLADQLNAEVAMGSVNSLKQAASWLGHTYLYVRMLRNPTLYQIDDSEFTVDPLLIRRRADLVHSAALILDKHGLIRYDRKSGYLENTMLGKIASNYYLRYPSIAVYNQHLKPNMGMIELFKIFSLSNEFKLIPIREEEKLELQRLAMSVPVPIKGAPEDPNTKVNVLLQAYISRLKLEGFALNSDMIYVTQSAARIMRALYEICLKHDWAQSAVTALNLAKMVEQRMWSCMTPLRQFKGLPEEILKRIEKKEGISWEHLYQMAANQIGELIRYANLGKTVHKLIHKFPRIEIQAFAQPLTRSCLRIDLQLNPDFQWDDKMHGKSEPFHIFVLDCDCEKILYSEQFSLKHKRVVLSENKYYSFSFTVPLFEIMHPIYFIKVVSDRWIQCESEQAIPFKNLILPEPFQRQTELLGRTPLPLDAIQYPNIVTALKKKVLSPDTLHFDPVQTQVFSNIYESDDSVFVGCPSFQSKHILPYLAVLASAKTHGGAKSVYVAPAKSTCETKFKDFVNLFTKSGVLHLKVGMLTGQINKDAKTLEASDIIISTARDWDIMSRRWRTRKGFNQIRLFIADDLHLLGEGGSVLEVVVSRMRMISAQTKPIRIVGLSLSAADYREIGEWIGATPQNTISFPPTAKPNKAKVQVNSFDQTHRPTRLTAMIKHIYPVLRHNSRSLSILYVSDRKLARLCALDLMALAQAEGVTFIGDQKDLTQFTDQIKGDQYLQYTVALGIGYLYESMNATDQEVVLAMIQLGIINAVVVTQGLALQLGLKSQQVVILDNYKYDGLEKRYVDYSLSQMHEMLESAENRCYVLVHAPKKEYFIKFLFEPLPIESHLNHFLANHLNAEIVAKNVNTTQDSIDWLTWSFMYRRLLQNPNYYNLSEISGTGVNNYLSELIENTIEELQDARCITVEDDQDLEAVNSGIIANYYYINVQTAAQFCDSIQDRSKMKDLLHCLSQAAEFDVMQIRNSEEMILAKLARTIQYSPTVAKLNEPNTKVFILLQAYFHRLPLNNDLKFDLNENLELAVRLSSAMVDIASSNLWLRPAILCMQLCQMLIQSMWVTTDSLLKQLPHVDDQLISYLKQKGVEDIADLMNMEDEDRDKALARFDKTEVELIATAANRFPTVEIKQVSAEEVISQNEVLTVTVVLERLNAEEYTDFVIAPRYPKPKEEQWWVLCADRKNNRLFGNKKVTLKDIAKIDLRFQAPEAGEYELTVYAICDSYLGADKIQTFNIKVTPPQEEPVQEEEDEQ